MKRKIIIDKEDDVYKSKRRKILNFEEFKGMRKKALEGAVDYIIDEIEKDFDKNVKISSALDFDWILLGVFDKFKGYLLNLRDNEEMSESIKRRILGLNLFDDSFEFDCKFGYEKSKIIIVKKSIL